MIPKIKYYERDEPVNAMTHGTQWLLFDNEKRNIQKRDKREENSLKKLLIGLHSNFESQKGQEHFKLRKEEFVKGYWFIEAFSILQKAKLPVQGLERLEGFDYHPFSPDIQMDVTADKGWFDIGLQVRFGDKVVDMDQLRKAIVKKKGMITLESGKKGIIPLAWQERLSGILSLGQESNGKLSLSKVHYPMMEKLYGKRAPKDIREWIRTKRKKLENPVSRGKIKAPKINGELRPYQTSGFHWMKALQEEEWGGILADDMGLGKTLQVLSLLLHTKESGTTKPNLLVVPKTLISNWEEQAEKFTPSLSKCRYYGQSRKQLPSKLVKHDLIITTYDTIKQDIKFFGKIDFQYLIADEAQAIKNHNTDRYRAVNLVNAQYRLAITGTPIENSVMDLYALMNFVNPGFFGTEASFRRVFLERGRADKSVGYEALQTAVNPFILRRTKELVAKDLPEKTEMVLFCEMEPEQRKAYETLRTYYKGQLKDQATSNGSKNSKLKILEGLMRLRQVCNHPQLVPDFKKYQGSSTKMDALLQHVLEKVDNHKILIFSQFTGMLELIRKTLEEKEIDFSYLDGQTSEASRRMAVNKFQNDDSVRVFLLSLKAGGSGLNLTAGDYVFLVDPWWNPAVESPAIDRCHRIGQDKKVMAYRMICSDTIEEKILRMQAEKKHLASELIQTEESLLKSMDTKALWELFK